MDHILTFRESADSGHFSQVPRDEFVRRLRSASQAGYSGSVHPDIVGNVLNWRGIFKSPTSNSLYSVMHDRQMLTYTGWQDRTMRMSDHWNNSHDMSPEEFLKDLHKFNESIPSHFYVSLHGDKGELYKLDLAIQKRLYEPDEDDDEDEPRFKDNRSKFDILVDAAERDADFEAAFIWHNKRTGMCSLAMVDERGWVHRMLTPMDQVEVHQFTLWTNKPVQNGTHWTVARYNKDRNVWVVQDTKPKGDYSDRLPRLQRN